MRVAFALPGIHRVNRGAEVALESIARNLALRNPDDEIVVFGSGPHRPNEPYRYEQVGLVPRERFERFPSVPMLRFPEMWEELTFTPGLLRRYRRRAFDISVACSYPFVNFTFQRWRSGSRSARHVFVTENGHWPAAINDGEARWFGCDGLVCTNPTYLEETAHLWPATLIPNGVDVDRFVPGPGERCAFDLPAHAPIVLMVSAAIASKRVEAGIRAVAQLPDAMLVVAGDGVLRHELDTLGQKLLGSRYRRLTVSADRMPDLYRCADAFLHLSSDESFGNVYVEALVSGLPCVVHDYALTRWIYDGAATLVDATDETTIVEGLRAALRAGPPTAEIVAAAHGRFSWATIADRYREFFERVLETTAATSEISA